MHYVPEELFRIVQGEDLLTSYQWNTGKAERYFCRSCGTYSFYKPRGGGALT